MTSEASEQERKPAFSTDYARMWDLVRHQRADLLDAGLITREEYGALALEEPGPGSPSPRRLESYDELRKQLAASEQARARERERLDELIVMARNFAGL